MIKQVQTWVTGLLTQIMSIVTKAVASVEAHVAMIATNPIKLLFVVLMAFLVADVVFLGHLKIIDYVISVANEIQKLITWPLAAIVIAISIVSITKK